MTLKLLYRECADNHVDLGQPVMSYHRLCRIYQRYVPQFGMASQVDHKAAQPLEVDSAGTTMRLVDPVRGKTSNVYLYVACLPFSRYAVVEPTLDMRQNTWLAANVAILTFVGGSEPGLCLTI